MVRVGWGRIEEGGWLIAGVSAHPTLGISYLKFRHRATETLLHHHPGRTGAHILGRAAKTHRSAEEATVRLDRKSGPAWRLSSRNLFILNNLNSLCFPTR